MVSFQVKKEKQYLSIPWGYRYVLFPFFGTSSLS